ncbi:AgmX/PglI C-terminal domain-containing protein [Stigmatella sp. ncwal1]|uniref:AgmX/PglI C-terminal domain-containing protein n=1 Tax=Stigmatella ashevillensis TaxID=2995309 RepID=A0ABT5DEL5_9BACT|nr:AgmX/PglI C-terminal domain-containing protein [Stigmatella ashevillena]MDC0711243.1 AgmX/PglI C-terminal domain-containing protein [Stigmatella ashevillena]
MGSHSYEAEPEGVVSVEVHDALGEDLDAYLDRELIRQPVPAPKPSVRTAPPVPKPRKSLQGMLALASEEERWLCSKPGPDGRPEPPKKGRASSPSVKPLEVKPPAVNETQTAQVLLPDLAWGTEPAPLSEEERSSLQKPWKSLEETLRPQGSHRRPLRKRVALGVGALGLLTAGALWTARSSLPSPPEVVETYVPAGPVAAVGPAAAAPLPLVPQAVATPDPVREVPKVAGPVPVPSVVKATPPPVARAVAPVAGAPVAKAPPRRAAPGGGPSAQEEEEDSASSNEDLPVRLEPVEIQRVVVANQPAIASCIRRHKEATGNEGGSFVLRWTILASGSTAQVGMATDEMRGTPLARCIEGLVRGWKFPRHRVQQAPIQFPFRF